LGTAFGNLCQGPLLMGTDSADYKLSVSAHGHLPVKGPHPTFFMAGPQIRKGVVIEKGHLIQEAPTWAAILGCEMPFAQGKVVTEMLNE